MRNEISYSIWLCTSAALIMQLKQHNPFNMGTVLSKLQFQYHMCTLVLSQLEPLAKTKTNKPTNLPKTHTNIPPTRLFQSHMAWPLIGFYTSPPKKGGGRVGNLFPQTHTSVSLPLYLPSSFVRSQGILLLISPNGTKDFI